MFAAHYPFFKLKHHYCREKMQKLTLQTRDIRKANPAKMSSEETCVRVWCVPSALRSPYGFWMLYGASIRSPPVTEFQWNWDIVSVQLWHFILVVTGDTLSSLLLSQYSITSLMLFQWHCAWFQYNWYIISLILWHYLSDEPLWHHFSEIHVSVLPLTSTPISVDKKFKRSKYQISNYLCTLLLLMVRCCF